MLGTAHTKSRSRTLGLFAQFGRGVRGCIWPVGEPHHESNPPLIGIGIIPIPCRKMLYTSGAVTIAPRVANVLAIPTQGKISGALQSPLESSRSSSPLCGNGGRRFQAAPPCVEAQQREALCLRPSHPTAAQMVSRWPGRPMAPTPAGSAARRHPEPYFLMNAVTASKALSELTENGCSFMNVWRSPSSNNRSIEPPAPR